MKGIDHLVLAGRDLEAQRSSYQALGFTLTPRGQLPFGIGNSRIHLHRTFLELVSVTVPQDVPEHSAGHFSFGAFNRDFLARHEGFSMIVLDTPDARADIQSWRAAGLQTYEPYDFARMAKMADGTEVKLGFSLAFVNHPAAPWLRLFACQHHTPEFFAQPQYLRHANGAWMLNDVWVTGETALDLADFIGVVTGAKGVREHSDRTVFQTSTGAIVLARPRAFEAAFGVPQPHLENGPQLAGLTVGCRSLGALKELGLVETGGRHVLAPARNFGVAMAFVERPQQ
jgi:hypothetical protein